MKYTWLNFQSELKKLGLPLTPSPKQFGKHLMEYQNLIGYKIYFYNYNYDE